MDCIEYYRNYMRAPEDVDIPVFIITSEPPKRVRRNKRKKSDPNVVTKKGRKRKMEQSREERRDNKYLNHVYVNSKNQLVLPKVFQDYNCNCPLKCAEKLTAGVRKEAFEHFNALGSYSAQNLFLTEHVEEILKKSGKVNDPSTTAKHQRTFTRIYHLVKTHVCKEMFLKTLKISSGRVNTVMNKLRLGVGLIDRRGSCKVRSNKIPEERLMKVLHHMYMIIKNTPEFYESSCVSNQMSLLGRPSFKFMFDLYKNEHPDALIGLSTYKSIYYKYFKNSSPGNIDEIYKDILNKSLLEKMPPVKLNTISNVEENKSDKGAFTELESMSKVETNVSRTNNLNESTNSNSSHCDNDNTDTFPSSDLPFEMIFEDEMQVKPVEIKDVQKKGRKRKCIQSRQERKDNKYVNNVYYNSRNKEIPPKVFKDYNCQCPLKCQEKASIELRKSEFDIYYNLGSYSAQNLFLIERINEIDKKRCYVKTDLPASKHKRVYSRIYTLENVKVCRKMFVKTLQVGSTKINNVLKKVRNGLGLADQRGSTSGGKNKLSNVVRQEVIDHIKSLLSPSLMSIYQRPTPGKGGYTSKQMYNMYVSSSHQSNRIVGFSTYKSIYRNHFSKLEK